MASRAHRGVFLGGWSGAGRASSPRVAPSTSVPACGIRSESLKGCLKVWKCVEATGLDQCSQTVGVRITRGLLTQIAGLTARCWCCWSGGPHFENWGAVCTMGHPAGS